LTLGVGRGSSTEPEAPSRDVELAARSQGGDETSNTADDSSSGTDEAPAGDFNLQCAMHILAAAFVASALVPKNDALSHVARFAAWVLAILSYAWALIAPQVLKNRDFGY